MYFYFSLAILAGIIFIIYATTFIFKTKMYTKKYDSRHFERSETCFRVLNAIMYIVFGLVLSISGVLAFIKSLNFPNHDLVYTCIFIVSIAFALLFTIWLESIFIESNKR